MCPKHCCKFVIKKRKKVIQLCPTELLYNLSPLNYGCYSNVAYPFGYKRKKIFVLLCKLWISIKLLNYFHGFLVRLLFISLSFSFFVWNFENWNFFFSFYYLTMYNCCSNMHIIVEKRKVFFLSLTSKLSFILVLFALHFFCTFFCCYFWINGLFKNWVKQRILRVKCNKKKREKILSVIFFFSCMDKSY